MQILIIDDDPAVCRSLQMHLEREGHTVQCAASASEGLEILEGFALELVLVDLQLPDMRGIEVLERLKKIRPQLLPVMITGTQDTKATIEAVRLGVFDYLRKPIDLNLLVSTVAKAERHFLQRVQGEVAMVGKAFRHRHEIVGADPKVIEVLKQIGRCSRSRVPVLILGESGTGKEIVARVLHETSTPDQPFIAVNCSAVVPTLLESEFFGHEKGAFTGAESTTVGKFELAGEGTLFLDEIGDMSLDLQAKLLRVLQEGEFERVGGTVPIQLKARIIAATHQNLDSLRTQGKFREDLFFRLAVAVIHTPPLRERRQDIPLLVEHLIGSIRGEVEGDLAGIEESALQRLGRHDWPGNVRELRNVLMRAAIMTQEPILSDELVLESMQETLPPSGPEVLAQDKETTLRAAEKHHVKSALRESSWNISRTAAQLDIGRATLRRKIQEYGLTPPDDEAKEIRE